MRVISRKIIKDFWQIHALAENPLKAWYQEAKNAQWNSFADIKQKYRSAAPVGNNRAVFNIGGNKFRLIVKFDFGKQLAFIKFVGTHAEYNKINAEEIG